MDLFQQVIWAFDICPQDNQLWYAAGALNGIFSVDIITGKTSFVTQFEAYSNRELLLYSYIVEREKYLYFCPYEADSVCEYNIVDGSKRFYFLEGMSNIHVVYAVLNGTNLFMFCEKGQIIILNLKSKIITVNKREDIYQRYLSGSFLGKDVVCKGSHLCFPDGHNVVELDKLLRIVNIYDFCKYSKGNEITTIACMQDKLWLTCNGSVIIYWDPKKNKKVTYTIPVLGLPIKSMVNDNKLYIFYRYVNQVLIFDMTNLNSLVVDIKEGYSFSQDQIQIYCTFKKGNTKGIYIYTVINHNIIHIEPDGTVTYSQLYLDDTKWFFRDYLSSFYCNNIIYEGKGVYTGLETFLGYKCKTSKDIENVNGIGKTIYNIIKIRR